MLKENITLAHERVERVVHSAQDEEWLRSFDLVDEFFEEIKFNLNLIQKELFFFIL